jgi:hypothetical protein
MSAATPPPNNRNAEEELIGHVLNHGSIPSDVNGLKPSDFYRPEHEFIWAAMIDAPDHCSLSSVIDRLEKRGQLTRGEHEARGGVGDLYLLGLLEVPPTGDPAHTAGIISEHARRRKMLEVADRLRQGASDPHADLEEIARRGADGLSRIAEPASEQDEALDLTLAVESAAHQMKIRDLARQKLAQEAVDELVLPDMIGLTDFLAQSDPPDRYLVDMNWPKGGHVLFSAQWKAGKSTARDNVVRSLADGEPFLGVYDVKPITEGTIVVFDDELHPDMLRRWLRDQGIVNTDRVVVVPMRGRVAAFDLTLPDVRAMWVQRLIEFRAVVVLLDCLRPILDALGLSEDKEAGRFLVAFDQMLDEAKIEEAMIIHHMGHTNERARGDSRILDWGDSLWKLVLDEDDKIPMDERARYFSAFGRGVSVRESRLSYDESARRLSIIGGTRRESKGALAWPDARAFIKDNPDCSGNRIEKHLEGKHSKEAVRAAIDAAEKRGDLHITRTGKGLANLHRLKETPVIETAQPTIEEATSPTSPDLATANPRTHLATSPTSPIGRGGGGGNEAVESRSETGEVRTSLFDLLTGGTWPICQRCGKPINVCRGAEHRMLFVLRAS